MAKLMMYDGKITDIFNLQKEDVDKEVIIRGSIRINRFLGQTSYAYPVASHLIGGWRYLNDIGADILLKKQWLIHEAFESYSGVDLPSPLKAMLPDYKDAEKRALKIIAEAFGVNPAESDEIKHLDRSIMVSEALWLMPNREYWELFALEQDIHPISQKYVLEAYEPEKLKTMLESIWYETFGGER
ncbi:hypothetical protein [Sulfurimonas sp.]|uniref:hypothetical protein n=1 Tax=Sulfurimonas sp. TaxID=2022749 RepID=UPI0025D6A686|nr:hypothetical protein [Sulfurimonas sp.]MBW6487504.1 hypothetical protein [Sulfurimonas sp.]